ncbi:uncharacterized protein [Dermacentor albipictus]|uniref:uncharacterized protein n=1 Tax=Dermacentor albipictus TaxID=60249 RepID=UPI0038FBFD64
MIPKPGKKLHLENLRPISLTSCAGKLMEHVILTRLTNYMEDNGLFPHTMIGFRPKLSTQDIMLQIKHQIIDAGPQTLDTKAILGLDLTKAFDNITHRAILENLQGLGVGQRTHAYVKDFLSDRVAQITIGEVKSKEIKLGSRGTPQGSVLSPFLFNVAMIGLPAELENIEGLHHSLYADDITLWVTGGSDGQIEEVLQTAIHTVEKYVMDKGLRCSPQKSELLLYRPTRRGRKSSTGKPNITLFVNGTQIPIVDSIRVLGLHVSANGHNGETIRILENSAQQTLRLIKRIANRHYGMKENNLVRLVQAFVISRIVYVTPYLNLQVAEKTKIDGIIRRSFKQAIGLPINTSNDRLLALGVHNTLEELIEAHTIAQYERLSQTPTGRHILNKLKVTYASQYGTKVDIPHDIRKQLIIPPLPKNMHPEHHRERREERARAIQRRFQRSQDVVYVDAAEYTATQNMCIVAVNSQGERKVSGSIKTNRAEVAEESAIALAMASTLATIIVSDSKTAILNYAKGRISPESQRILANFRGERVVHIIWAPAHSSLPGNEAADTVARGLTNRATGAPRLGLTGDRMVGYREITNHYRFGRVRFPPAHPSLNKQQAVAWRLLQTNTYPNPVSYNHYYPDQYSANCKLCQERADLDHIIWACPQAPRQGRKIQDRKQWETVLLSSAPEDQLLAVQQAEDAARAQGLLAAI